MIECVKCGHHNSLDAPACVRCTWPFTTDAWASTDRFRIKRVTIDTNCINSKREDIDLNTLEKWSTEGLLTLQRADVLLKELKGSDQRVAKGKSFDEHPELFRIGISALGSGHVLAGPDMQDQIRRILFPTTRTLTVNQENDVEHLRQHIQTGGDAFITKNTKDFINNGKQERLAYFGIWVLTPTELVTLLRRLYQWS